MARIYAGSYGIRITLDTKEDLTSASALSICVKFPDGTSAEWTAAMDPVKNTAVTYVTQQGELDQAGKYSFQVHYVMGVVHGWGDPYVYTIYPLFQV